MEIKITNPTPTVETADKKPDESPVSYHVEDPAFSMKMSSAKVSKYQAAVPVEVEVTVEAPPTAPPVREPPQVEAPEPEGLSFVQCVVTAPTPHNQSPAEDDPKLFPVTSCSETEDEGGMVTGGGTGWTDSEQAGQGGWADFPAPEEQPEAAEPAAGGWADFGSAGSEPEKVKEAPKKPESKAEQPAVVTESKEASAPEKAVAAHIMADLVDSEESDSDPEINFDQQRPKGGATIIAESSSDSESEAGAESAVPETEDDRKRADSSSETESEDGPGATDTSRDVTPAPPQKASDMRLPPENLDEGKLKRLETMKESSA